MRDERVQSEIYKLIDSLWNNEQLPMQWTDFIIAPVYQTAVLLTSVIIEDISVTNYIQKFFYQN
jgi:hypothetical protein